MPGFQCLNQGTYKHFIFRALKFAQRSIMLAIEQEAHPVVIHENEAIVGKCRSTEFSQCTSRYETSVGVQKMYETLGLVIVYKSDMTVIRPDSSGVFYIEFVWQENVTSAAQNIVWVSFVVVKKETNKPRPGMMSSSQMRRAWLRIS
jgi:hypothetical protein